MADQPQPLLPRAERCPGPECTDERQCWRCDYEESQHATAVAIATGYCPHCGSGDAGPTADMYEASQRRAVRIQTLLDEQRDRVRKLAGEWQRTGAQSGAVIAFDDAAAALTATLEPPKDPS